MAAILKLLFFALNGLFGDGTISYFFRVLKTIIMPNFMLLTESEQLEHISALLISVRRAVTSYALQATANR